jgi:nitrite reductase (NADH) large subunit
VAILGGGLLGIELARALQLLGCRVEIFERAAHLLPRQLDAAAAHTLERQVRSLGVGLTLACQVESLEPSPAGARLRVPGGGSSEFALVVVAAGVRPRDELAREAGLACHPRGGILVDDRLGTKEPGVHAIGECARHQGVVYGLASPCLAMADALADNLCGGSRRFRRVAPATRLKADRVDVSVAGATRLDGPGITRVTHEQEGCHRSLVLFEGRVVGAVAVGGWPEWHRVQEALSRRRLLMPWQRRRLASTGLAFRERAGRSIERWSDAAIVCTCMGVDCGALRAARAEGCLTASALTERTGAASACGTCRPLLEALAGDRADAVRAGAGRALLPAGAAAAVLVAVLALAPPIPFADTVQGGIAGIQLDALWRSDLARQVTGFTALAACLASLLFSLRKRWPRLAGLSYTRWRGAHAILGVAALAGVAVHTGLRLGTALDRALVLCFLALAALGATAGIATALEPKLSPAAGARVRRASTAVHTLAFWPFPVLVLFHVLKTYWY